MAATRTPRQPIRIPVPGLKRTVGLGQGMKYFTSAIGFRACGGCQRRARALDRFVVMTPPRSK
jgi:hypothetical protein